MKKIIRAVVIVVAALGLLFGAASCTGKSQELIDREKQNQAAKEKKTLEKENIARKLKLDEDPNRVGYVYIMSFGKFVGYYTIKGKISSNGSQLEPEDQILCPLNYTTCSSDGYYVLDGPQDDGTYGEGDPGIFFFTTEGTMVVTDLDYLYSNQPIPAAIDVPKLG